MACVVRRAALAREGEDGVRRLAPARRRGGGCASRLPLRAAVAGDASAPSHGHGGLVVVLGAGGRTGWLVCCAAAACGVRVRACTRDGTLPTASSAHPAVGELITATKADVTRRDEVARAIEGATACVFAATAGAAGDATAVDAVAAGAAARACVAAGVNRFVLISGAGVTEPASQAYRFLNLFGRRMDSKVSGEEGVRAAYASAPDNVCYTVIRPSGLVDGARKGVGALTVRQGDGAAGRVSRADVADLIAALCESDLADASGGEMLVTDASFEVYDTGSGVSTKALTVGDILSDEALANSAVLRLLGAAPQSPERFAEEGGERGSRSGCTSYVALLSGLASDLELRAGQRK